MGTDKFGCVAWARMKKPMPNGDRGVSSDELSQQAWAWLRLLSSRQVSEEDMQGFRRWVKSRRSPPGGV